MSELKVAVIGCGDAARVGHLPWYAMNPHTQVVALVDPSEKQAAVCMQRFDGKHYTDLDAMLSREKPDIVSVCSPVHLHEQHVIACAGAVANVLCEKPMAPTIGACQRMIDTGAKLGLGFMRRFSAGYELARKLVREGRIGDVLFARGFWIVNRKWEGFRVEPQTGGGVFQDCGSHFVDAFRWLLDDQIVAIQGSIELCRPDAQVEDHAIAILTSSRGPKCTIETSWVGPSSYINEHIEETWIYGSEGAIKVTFPSSPFGVAEVELWDRRSRQWTLLPMKPFEKRTFENCHYKRLVDAFVDSVLSGEPFAPSGEDGLKAIEAVLGLYVAADSGARVSLPLAEDPDVAAIFAKLKP